jgi:hypothetical protein
VVDRPSKHFEVWARKVGNVIKQVGCLSIAGLLGFASIGFAQYTMDLTGVGNGTTADGVYVSPYVGSIWKGTYMGGGAPNTTPLFSGYVICDDFSDESYVGDVWNASSSNAGAVSGNVLFDDGYNPFLNITYTAQQGYDAVAYLANQLVASSNVNDPTAQTNLSFAIWDIMDDQQTDPDGGASALIAQAFNAVVNDNYVGSNVTVYTPSQKQPKGQNVSQEFLTVTAPEPAAAAVLGLDLLSVRAIVFLLRRYWVRA